MKINFNPSNNETYKVTNKQACRMCGNWCDFEIAEISSENTANPILKILSCSTCKSINYEGEDPVIGYEDKTFSQDYWLHYVQVGAGITAMLEPLFALGHKCSGKLLDIGCGFGFVVDFWNKSEYGKAYGLEKAHYGAIGANLLECPIYNSYYADCNELSGEKFDIVYSSEVLEHVKNPQEFINDISQALSPTGILVLTTPSADAVNIKNNPSDIIAALSPYFHYFLSSEVALKNLLFKNGFQHVKVFNSGERLFAWASKVELPDINVGKINWDKYFSYLLKLSTNNNPNIKTGALYRLFKDSWNTGSHDTAATAFSALEKFSLEQYGLSFRNPEIQRYLNRKSAVKNLDSDPAWYGGALLWGGMLVGHIEGNRVLKVRMIDAACSILEYEASNLEFTQFSQEAQQFYPYAMNQRPIAYSEALNQWIDASRSNKNINLDNLRPSLLCSLKLFNEIFPIHKKEIKWSLGFWKNKIKQYFANSLK